MIFEKLKENQAHKKFFATRNLDPTARFNPSILSVTSHTCVTEPMQRMKRLDMRDALSSLKVTKLPTGGTIVT